MKSWYLNVVALSYITIVGVTIAEIAFVGIIKNILHIDCRRYKVFVLVNGYSMKA